MTRLPDTVRERIEKKDLGEFLTRYTKGEGMYLAALARGYSVQEAHDIAKSLGINIDASILRPEVVEARELLQTGGWYTRKEAHDYWIELLGKHYEEIMVVKGIEEMGKEALMRDMGMVKECTKMVVARMGKRGKEVVKEEGRNYDELILKRHRDRGGSDGEVTVVERLPGGDGGDDR
jgi:hypothetical protein